MWPMSASCLPVKVNRVNRPLDQLPLNERPNCLPHMNSFAVHWFSYYWYKGYVILSAMDYRQPYLSTVNIVISYECTQGRCMCTYTIAYNYSHLLPCRMFTETFLRGVIDIDWQFIMYGTLFGFKVIDDTRSLSYSAHTGRSRLQAHHTFISDKLKKELSLGYISLAGSCSNCTHNMLCIPKDLGSVGRL